jgi:hypothetical protein
MYICVALIYPQVTLATTHYMTVSCSWKQYYYIFYKRKTCLVGDLNSRTADYDDFITDDSVHSSLQDRLNNLFTYTNDLCLSKRMNPDKSRNEYGSKLLKLCKSTGLRILNGRHGSGFANDYAYCGATSLSVIDYLISTSIFDHQKHTTSLNAFRFKSRKRFTYKIVSIRTEIFIHPTFRKEYNIICL